jgi:hypothetical protein
MVKLTSMTDEAPRPPLEDLTVADKATDRAWAATAADLSRELGFEILWCPLGFEVPTRDGGITHVSSADAVREELRKP